MFKNLIKNTDYIVLICILVLFVIGVVAIFSAGYATEVNKDEYIKQMVWFGIVFAMMVVIWCIDYNTFDIFRIYTLCNKFSSSSRGIIYAQTYGSK